MSFTTEWEQEKDRLSRIETQLAVMPPHQRKRLEEVQRLGELALARTFGNRLPARVSARLIEGMALSPEVLCSIGGGVNELPTDQAGWNRWAADAVNADTLSKMAVDAADMELAESLTKSVLESIPPSKRISMARLGTLDEYVASAVKAELEARSGV